MIQASETSTGLPQKTIDKINEIFKKHPKIEQVILYGSRAKGNFRAASDIDLTIISHDMDLSELLKIENELDDLLLPYKIDLSIKSTLENKALLEHIEHIGIIFYKKN